MWEISIPGWGRDQYLVVGEINTWLWERSIPGCRRDQYLVVGEINVLKVDVVVELVYTFDAVPRQTKNNNKLA